MKKSRKASWKRQKLIYGLKAKKDDTGMNTIYFGKTGTWSHCFFFFLNRGMAQREKSVRKKRVMEEGEVTGTG